MSRSQKIARASARTQACLPASAASHSTSSRQIEPTQPARTVTARPSEASKTSLISSASHSVAQPWEGGREGEVRYLGEFDNTPDAVAKLIRKLAGRYETLPICYEAGPTGYGLYR